jgi:hypothetical protein
MWTLVTSHRQRARERERGATAGGDVDPGDVGHNWQERRPDPHAGGGQTRHSAPPQTFYCSSFSTLLHPQGRRGGDGAGERRTMSSGACRVVRGTEPAVGQRAMATLFSVRTGQANTNCRALESSVSRWSKVSSHDLPHQQPKKKCLSPFQGPYLAIVSKY